MVDPALRDAGEVRDALKFLLSADYASYVHFVESRGRGVFLRAAPIDVTEIVQEHLFKRMRTTILTSATLAVALGKVAPEKYADDYVKSQFDKEHTIQERNAINFGSATRENAKIVEALSAKRIDKDQKEK